MSTVTTPSALIIDDSPLVRTVLSALLRQQAVRTTAVADGEAGLRAARESRPDLICLDLMLPNQSGLDVCKQLRAEPETSTVPILMVSARPYPQDQAAAMAAGADAFLPKPLDPAAVTATVRMLLWRAHQERTR